MIIIWGIAENSLKEYDVGWSPESVGLMFVKSCAEAEKKENIRKTKKI